MGDRRTFRPWMLVLAAGLLVLVVFVRDARMMGALMLAVGVISVWGGLRENGRELRTLHNLPGASQPLAWLLSKLPWRARVVAWVLLCLSIAAVGASVTITGG
jgi:hypothetical protein